MNISAETPFIWTQTAKAHRIEKRYSRRFLEAIIRNPQEVKEHGGGRWVVSGYGYGAVVALKRGQLYVVACFSTDVEAKCSAA